MVVDVKGGQIAANIRQEFGEVAKKLRSKDRESVWPTIGVRLWYE